MSENTTRSRQPLLRNEDQKMIAGVCTGLGHHFDVDPVVFRILFAVLTFFGGLGLLAYAACWLVIPARGERDSEAQRLLTGPNVYVAAGAAALMVLGLLWFTDIIAIRLDHSLPVVLAGAAAVGVVIWRRENHTDPKNPEDRRTGPGSNPTPGAPFDQPQPWWQRPVGDHSQPPADGSATPSAPGPSTPKPTAGDHIAAALFPNTPTKNQPDTPIPGLTEPADRIEPASSEPTLPRNTDTDTDTDTDGNTAAHEGKA